MKPPKGSGLEQLELIRKMLMSKYAKYSLDKKKNTYPKKFTCKKRTGGSTKPLPNPFDNLDKMIRNLSSTITTKISQFTKRNAAEDYDSIVRGFVPEDARLVKPLYPANSNDILLADLDGDSQNEMVASFKINEGIRTLVLKKHNGKWNKAAEINNPEHDGVNFRNIADITGEGRKHLLLGMTSNGKAHSLYGYSLRDANKKLFTRNYHWAEIVAQPKNRAAGAKTQLALWNRGENGLYNVEVFNWNGLQLEPIKDTVPYYYDRMVPYYVRKLRQNPRTSHSWYNLADAMVKAEAYNDALTITDMGMRQNMDAALKDRFTALRNEIVGKL